MVAEFSSRIGADRSLAIRQEIEQIVEGAHPEKRMRDFRSSRMFWYATKTDVLSPSDLAYPLLKASPTGRELQELFTPNLFELGFSGQKTRQPIP